MHQITKAAVSERKWLSLTLAAQGKPIPIGLVQTRYETTIDKLSEYSVFHFLFIHWAVWMLISDCLSNNHLDFNLSLHIFCYCLMRDASGLSKGD